MDLQQDPDLNDLNTVFSFLMSFIVLCVGAYFLAENAVKKNKTYDKGYALIGLCMVGVTVVVSVVGIINIVLVAIVGWLAYFFVYWVIWRSLIKNFLAILPEKKKKKV
ncbi:MAG: hypothetical protein HGB26_03860 [Desulfobulbaceae bacterium]|nr:hypothetical protein [Desulfobulbaceae bacterium]